MSGHGVTFVRGKDASVVSLWEPSRNGWRTGSGESEPLGFGRGAFCGGGIVGQQLGEGVDAGIGSVDQRVLVLASAEHFFGDVERG